MNKARSIVATLFFLLVTIVLSLISIPAALLDRSGRFYLWLARIWSKTFLLLFGIKLTIHGQEHLKRDEHYVFVANHASYTDIPMILAGIPLDIRLILRKSLTKIPIWGWALVASPMIIIDLSNAVKAKKTLSNAVEIIRGGASILLFPEGTRTHDGKLQAFKRGAFHLAYESKASVIPVALAGTFDVLPRTSRLPICGSVVELKIGEPLFANELIPSEREREMDLMRRAEGSIREMLA